MGRFSANSNDVKVTSWLERVRETAGPKNPEVEIAFARVAPLTYFREYNGLVSIPGKSRGRNLLRSKDWRISSAAAQGLGELATTLSGKDALSSTARLTLQAQLASVMCDPSAGNSGCLRAPDLALPDIMRAFAAFKPETLDKALRPLLHEEDVVVRATAAELIAELPPADENSAALIAALSPALKDTSNDAALSLLDALGKQKSARAIEAVKSALDSDDQLIRRRAVAILKANAAGDFSSRIGTVRTRNTIADYRRALARIGKPTHAVVMTKKGSFTVELLPEESPLNVDNFMQLAKRGYFNGITFHRVVPNFVIQGGDPRGDGNGGPGYQIRCEINEVSFERAAVGMALSGKDTGGSQWFVTHSPQPHLDGGYTVFGQVIEGMEVVDRIDRGDEIISVSVTEAATHASNKIGRRVRTLR
jgi:cyclophilin family peptidyl-prolyl cis-trans isomerase